jgi:hypothetical protein
MSPAQEQLRRSYKRSYKTYSYEQLVAAYLYVKEKRVAVKFAARAFGVPPSTLNDRVQGKVFIDTSIVKTKQIYWSEQSFTGLGPEDLCSP